jgi:transcriptional regulator with XRE-family HTH domain
MAVSPSSSAQAARVAIAARLRNLMLDAGLNGHELTQLCGWSASKTSRILHAKTPASDDDIRTWCQACGSPAEAPDIIEANRVAGSAYQQWKLKHRTGMRKAQEESAPLMERAKLMRVYASNVVPGMLQTAAYATSLMTTITTFQGTPDDVADAVSARVARSRIIHEGNHRLALLIEEAVLHYRVADDATMAAQLDSLLTAMSLPRVSIGIVPLNARRQRMWPLEAYYMYDDERVHVELLAAFVAVTAPSEVAVYSRAFGEIAGAAVHGDQARALIQRARQRFGGESTCKTVQEL